jgi:hypothetical protein
MKINPIKCKISGMSIEVMKELELLHNYQLVKQKELYKYSRKISSLLRIRLGLEA